ncbi:MAG TPA: CBS domain-containing protein [Acidimicrobiales bacterium]|nr:CBS domain-containing protein [Acidimicrobiales bacterium]
MTAATTTTTTTSVGSMRVSELLGARVTRVPQAATIVEVATTLAANDIGVVAVGIGDQILGVLSERDIVRALASGGDPATITASELAHTDLVWCDASATVAEVGLQMMEHWVRHVLVERKGHLVGIVSARDLLGVYVANDS